jgi:hypothetical protein
MVAQNPGEIARAVQESLKAHGSDGRRARVESPNVRPGDEQGGWWYVPVAYYPGDGRDWKFFEMFSDVEDALERDQGLNILIVPHRLHTTDPD